MLIVSVILVNLLVAQLNQAYQHVYTDMQGPMFCFGYGQFGTWVCLLLVRFSVPDEPSLGNDVVSEILAISLKIQSMQC